MPDTPDVRLTLRWEPAAVRDGLVAPPDVALRQALSVLLRRFGWRAVVVEELKRQDAAEPAP